MLSLDAVYKSFPGDETRVGNTQNCDIVTGMAGTPGFNKFKCRDFSFKAISGLAAAVCSGPSEKT